VKYYYYIQVVGPIFNIETTTPVNLLFVVVAAVDVKGRHLWPPVELRPFFKKILWLAPCAALLEQHSSSSFVSGK
jgi:hypothetical protein